VQTIIINLPSDDARGVEVRRQFHRAGLRPIYHEATDGSRLSTEEIDRLNALCSAASSTTAR